MQYRRLGKHGIRVSEISLGGWLTQGRTLEDDATERIVRHAFDLGINLFDSADAYNAGEAEISLGKSVKGLRREDLVIATKCFFPITQAPNDRGLSRKHIVESVHKSLKRLDTDYIDLMQCHRFDAETPVEETVRAMEDLIRQGKVLYWGVSEWSAEQIAEAVHIAREYRAYAPASNQPYYNMLGRHIEASVMPACERHGLGLIVFSPLAQGVLTGKYEPGKPLPQGSRGADDTSNMFMKGMLENQAMLERVQRLKAFAAERDLTLPQLALAWCLRKPAISSVIVGATSTEQVYANVSASGVHLDDATWAEAERLLEDPQ